MSSNDNDQKPAGEASGGPLKSLFTFVIYVFAFLAAIVVKPAQALTREAYNKSNASSFAFGAGILLSVIGSIATGYFGWQHGIAVQWWLSTAVAAPFAIYYYAWPIAFLAVGRWAYKFAELLWRNVPGRDDRRSETNAWFTFALLAVAQIAIVGGCIYLFWNVTNGIHDWTEWHNKAAWLFGGVIGVCVGFGVGALLTGALWEAGMPLVAVVSGAALTYFFGIDLSHYVPTFGYDAAVKHVGQALQGLLWVGYVFPLGHIIISRMFGWMGKYFTKLLDKTYNDSDKNWLTFLSQLSTLALTGAAGYYAYGYAGTFGYGVWLAAPAAAVAVLAAYILAGFALRNWSNMTVGVVSSIAAAVLAFIVAPVFVPFGVFGAIVFAVFAAALNALFVFPLVYQTIKLIANPLFASWSAQPLKEMHSKISTEVFSAASKTYDDKTPYASLFTHVVNVAVAVAVYLLSNQLVDLIHLSGWTALVLPGLLTAVSYLFVGRLLVAYKTTLIGSLAAIGVGAFVGVEVFAHFDHNLWKAVPAFIGAGLVFGLAVFPVTYVVLRAGLELIAASKWATPVVEGVYNFFFGFVRKFATQFMIVYRKISLSFAPIWASVSKQFDEAWASAKETFEKAFNGKDKK